MAHHSVLPRMPGCSSTTRPTHVHILLTTFTPSCVSDVSVSLHLRSFHHHELSSLTKSVLILPRVIIQIRSGSLLSLCPFLSHPRCGWHHPVPFLYPSLSTGNQYASKLRETSLWDVLRNEPQKEAVKWNPATGLRP